MVADIGASHPGRHPVQGIGRLVGNGYPVARARVGARAEHQQIVGARAEDDVLGLDAVVVGDRLQQLRKAAVQVGLDPLKRSGDRLRPGGRRRLRGRVAVEAEDVLGR